MLTLSSNKLFILLSLNLLILFLTINKSSVNGKVLTQVEKHHHHDHEHRHHHHQPTDQQQSTASQSTSTTIKPTFYVGIGPWVKHEITSTPKSIDLPTKSAINKRVNNNQQLKSSSSQNKESILMRSNQPITRSNPIVNHVNNKMKSSPSTSSIQYGFTDQDYPYIIGKTDKSDSPSTTSYSSSDYRGDYYDDQSSQPSSPPPSPSALALEYSSTSNYPKTLARKVLKCRTTDGRALSDDQCKQKLAQKRSLSASGSKLDYLDQPIYKPNNNQNSNGASVNHNNGNLNEGGPRMSGKVGRDEDTTRRYQDDYEAKEDEKWTRGLREWDRDESPVATTERSRFGARSGRSSNPSSSSPTPKGAFSSDDDSNHESGDVGIRYFTDKGNTKDEDKYYSPPDYNFRESGPVKKSANSYGSSSSTYSSSRSSPSSSSSGPSSEANYDDYTDGSSGVSESPSSSDSDEPSTYNSDEPSYSKSSDENEKQSTKPSDEPSYNYRGSDDYLSSKSSKSSSSPPPTANNGDSESTNYYKPSQGYDDYAEGQTSGGQDDEGKQSDSDGESDRDTSNYKEDDIKYKEGSRKKKSKSSSSPPPPSDSSSYHKKQDKYKPDESYDENDDDSGSAGPVDYNNYGKSDYERHDDPKSNYDDHDDKPESKSRSNEEEEFDAAFKEPLTGSGFNFHQQESRAIGNFANNKQNKSIIQSPDKLIKTKSSPSMQVNPSSSSPSPYLSTSSSSSTPQPKKLTDSRSYIKHKNGAKAVVSASILVN